MALRLHILPLFVPARKVFLSRLFIIFFFLLIPTCVQAQSVKLSLSINQQPLREILNIIEEKTGYSYLVRSNDVNLEELFSISATNKSLQDILSQLFEKKQINYEIKGRNISIFKSRTESANLSVEQFIRMINGKIVDNAGIPISNANVLIKGTHYGIVSDQNGSFRIEAPIGTTLIISHIGYSTANIKIGNQEDVEIRLTESTNPLNELVVIGFGTQREQEMTSSVAQINSKTIEDKSYSNVASSLQGEVSGVNISQLSGQPGTMPNITIRGTSSLLGSTGILTIIDGIPGSMSLLNPDDVESISILKDAAACAVYGARAANGVVLVTTKRGKLGEISLNYSGYVGFQQPTKIFQEADAYNYANAYNTALMCDAISPTNTAFDESRKVFSAQQLNDWKSGKVASTNWRKALFSQNNGFVQSHSVNIAGGISGEEASLKNNFSINYLQQNGNVANTCYSRYGVRENGELKWNQLTAALIVGLSYVKRVEPNSQIGDLSNIINAINRQRPTDPIKVYNDWSTLGSKDTRNPIRQALEGGKSSEDLYNALANVNFSYNIFPGFIAKAASMINMRMSFYDSFVNSLEWITAHDDDGNAVATETTGINSVTKTDYKDIHYLQQFDLEYRKKNRKNNFQILFGGQQEYHVYNELTAYKNNFILNSSSSLSLGAAQSATNGSYYYDWAIQGLFARFNYDYDKRYLFEFDFREDGSSRLTPGKTNWGFFPSVSAGWRISEEKFMQSWKNTISRLKLRASYGILGNTDLPTVYSSKILQNNQYYYSYNSLVGPYGEYYAFGSTLYVPMTLTQNPNNSFTWEKTAVTDISLEGDLWNGRVPFAVGWFYKKTYDMFLIKEVSSVNGGSSYVDNIGSMRNTGVEIELGLKRTFSNGIQFNVKSNLSYMTNKILDLGGQKLAASGVNINMVGYPVNAFYLYESDGILTKEEYTNGADLLKGQKWGDQKIKDVTGEGTITADDRVNTGKSSTPRWYYGLSIELSYKGFGVSSLIQGAADYYKYLGGNVGYGFNSGYGITNWTIDNSYNPLVDENNYNTRLPRVSITNTINNNYPSTMFLFNSSYVRLKNTQFYYNVPTVFIRKTKINGIKIYVSAQNLFTLSAIPKALGIDPEISNATSGYPLVKVFTTGINVRF
ncbi:MAG: TonB-dependent receptor [Paludibacteraceae bacterium]